MIIGGRAHTLADIELIGKAGFPFAEISILDPRAFFDEELERLRQLRDAYGLTYLAHGPEEGNAWEPEVLRRDFLPQARELIDCLQELSIALFTIHFWVDRRFLDGSIISEKVAILREIALYAADRGVRLCIENLSEHFSDFARVFNCIESLGMTLDIGHGALLTKKNTAFDFTRHCPERIQHVHIHDNRGGDSPSDDLHLSLGEGTIDFAPILLELKRTGFDKTVTLEVKPSSMLNGKKMIEDIWHRNG